MTINTLENIVRMLIVRDKPVQEFRYRKTSELKLDNYIS